jgi:hypothetical protein
MDAGCGSGAGGEYFQIGVERFEESFCHLTPAGVAGAEDENSRMWIHT